MRSSPPRKSISDRLSLIAADAATLALMSVLVPPLGMTLDRTALFSLALCGTAIARYQTGLWNPGIAGFPAWWARVAFSGFLGALWSVLAALAIDPRGLPALVLYLPICAAAAVCTRLGADRLRSARSAAPWAVVYQEEARSAAPLPGFLRSAHRVDISDLLGRTELPSCSFFVEAGVRPRDVEILRSAAHLMGVDVVLAPSPERLSLNLGLQAKIDDLPVVILRSPVSSAATRTLRRAFDLAAASALLLVFAPALGIIAVRVRAGSPGPAIYRQQRVGRDGTVFDILKFRTMYEGSEDATGPVLASRDDRRVTPQGRWLRPSRLDELPQLVNVLRGEMSIIGPRPERPEFVEAFAAGRPEYHIRHIVKPGITGLAQVAGAYTTDAEDKLGFDLRYIHGRTAVMDARILLQTVLVMLKPSSASGIASQGVV